MTSCLVPIEFVVYMPNSRLMLHEIVRPHPFFHLVTAPTAYCVSMQCSAPLIDIREMLSFDVHCQKIALDPKLFDLLDPCA